jgi:hypothetical protein
LGGPGKVEIVKHFERTRWKVAAADYPAWRAWLAQVDGALGGTVVIGPPARVAP